MTEHDLGELYTYLELFRKVYGGYDTEVHSLMSAILDIYMDEYRHKNADAALRELRNPRGAGRKTSVSDDSRERIRELRGLGLSIRKISAKTGIPRSTVQRILSGL